MRTRSKWLTLLIVLGLVVAACGGAAETTTTAGPAATTTAPEAVETTAGEAVIATDVGVDLDAGVIRVGLLSDLSGPFSPLVQAIVTGQEVYWEDVNAAGGINGLQVELVTRDTGYVVEAHVQLYNEIKDEVVAFGHSTGSPQTVAIREALEADGILAIPLTWYSGWSDPLLNANLVPHGAPYCIEAMNMLEFLTGVTDGTRLAIATLPGDYGLDSAAGAKLAAGALGLEIVYDGAGALTDEASFADAANAIVASDADIVWLTATPTSFSAVYGQALAQGFEAVWSGAYPSWSPAFVAPDSAIRDAIARDLYIGSYIQPWSGDSEGAARVRELITELRPGTAPFDYFGEGFVEAQILHQALLRAYDNGDMTQAGVLAAAKSLENVDFDGLAPNETYVGDANERLQRAIYVARPDPEGLVAGTSSGITIIEELYTSEIAAAYEFTGACFVLG